MYQGSPYYLKKIKNIPGLFLLALNTGIASPITKAIKLPRY